MWSLVQAMLRGGLSRHFLPCECSIISIIAAAVTVVVTGCMFIREGGGGVRDRRRIRDVRKTLTEGVL